MYHSLQSLCLFSLLPFKHIHVDSFLSFSFLFFLPPLPSPLPFFSVPTSKTSGFQLATLFSTNDAVCQVSGPVLGNNIHVCRSQFINFLKSPQTQTQTLYLLNIYILLTQLFFFVTKRVCI